MCVSLCGAYCDHTTPRPRGPCPQIARIMDKFESQFETLDVRTGYMDAAMDG